MNAKATQATGSEAPATECAIPSDAKQYPLPEVFTRLPGPLRDPRPFVPFLPERSSAVHIAQPLWPWVRASAYVLACDRQEGDRIPVQWGEVVPSEPTCAECIAHAREHGIHVARVKTSRPEPY